MRKKRSRWSDVFGYGLSVCAGRHLAELQQVSGSVRRFCAQSPKMMAISRKTTDSCPTRTYVILLSGRSACYAKTALVFWTEDV